MSTKIIENSSNKIKLKAQRWRNVANDCKMKAIWLFLTNWCFTIISYVVVFLMPAYLIYYFFMDKTLGTPNEENGKAVIYFIISLIFSPVTIGGNMYLREKIDELLGVTFEERYNA